MKNVYSILTLALLLVACGKEPTSNESLKEFRMAQYGVATSSDAGADQIRTIELLESTLKPYVEVRRNQPAALKTSVSTVQAASEFGITDKSTPQELARWTTWFNARFTPVYLAHMASLYNMACSRDLDKVDQLLDTTNQLDFLKLTDGAVGSATYQVTGSPFTHSRKANADGDDLSFTRSDIAELKESLTERIESTRDERDARFAATAVPACD